jgi:hypothetical protein
VSNVTASSPSPVVVGRGRHRPQRDATRLGDHRALEALLAAVHRAWAGGLAAAGRLGGAPVHGQLLQLQGEQPLVGAEHRQAQPFGEPEGDPLVPPAAQRGRRAGVVGDAAVAAAEHQDLDQLVEHDPVSDAGPVAAQWMGVLLGGQQRGHLDPKGFEDGRWQGRHETSGGHRASRTP